MNSNKVFLKPTKAGTIVRDPVTRIPLPDEGEGKELNTYWRRRIKDGDVVYTDVNGRQGLEQPVEEKAKKPNPLKSVSKSSDKGDK